MLLHKRMVLLSFVVIIKVRRLKNPQIKLHKLCEINKYFKSPVLDDMCVDLDDKCVLCSTSVSFLRYLTKTVAPMQEQTPSLKFFLCFNTLFSKSVVMNNWNNFQ